MFASSGKLRVKNPEPGPPSRQRDRETKRQRDRETERQRDRKTERERERQTGRKTATHGMS